MKPLNKVKIEWSPSFAYAIGLIATDGYLSVDRRHITMTSKDLEQIESFKRCLAIQNRIGRKSRAFGQEKRYYYVHLGDRVFYDFLLSIGLTPAKSKTLKRLRVPDEYFVDFLRGCIDGDGNINIFWHSESRHPQLRVRLSSASIKFLEWIRREGSKKLDIKGGWLERSQRCWALAYGKADSVRLLNFLYYRGVCSYLMRKYWIAKPFLN